LSKFSSHRFRANASKRFKKFRKNLGFSGSDSIASLGVFRLATRAVTAGIFSTGHQWPMGEDYGLGEFQMLKWGFG
jgi:hypothetical protein